MKNVIAIVCILGLISCGNESDESCHNTVPVDTVCTDTTNVVVVSDLLDSLQTLPSDTITE